MKPHAPFAHVALAFAGTGHALSQNPQFITLVCKSISQPSVELLLQLPKPVLHAKVQELFEHDGVALGLFGQTFPQKPQFCGSDAGVVSQPSGSIPLQSALPGAQMATHEPAEQTGVAEG
ncbi:MAG: hypothetical protein IPM54_06235 [Polyangiaceae bacterium]|nr:hypothetical protein [Polyangiaceae bacterium]